MLPTWKLLNYRRLNNMPMPMKPKLNLSGYLLSIDARAAAQAPDGYVLWSCYQSKQAAILTKRNYGYASDKIKQVGRSPWWALYGKEAA